MLAEITSRVLAMLFWVARTCIEVWNICIPIFSTRLHVVHNLVVKSVILAQVYPRSVAFGALVFAWIVAAGAALTKARMVQPT